VLNAKDYRIIAPLTALEMRRLMAKIRKNGPNGCWLWTGHATGGGYGRICIRGQVWTVHRLIFELLVRHVEIGEVVDHLCRNRICCNPEHLEAVVQAINIKRARIANGNTHWRHSITHCPQGHPLSGDNLLWATGHGKTYRLCRICDRRRKASHDFKRRTLQRVINFWSTITPAELARLDAEYQAMARGHVPARYAGLYPPREPSGPIEGSGPSGARRPVP
jgi:hypothetical protein